MAQKFQKYAELDRVLKRARHAGSEVVVTTEKDAVRIPPENMPIVVFDDAIALPPPSGAPPSLPGVTVYDAFAPPDDDLNEPTCRGLLRNLAM